MTQTLTRWGDQATSLHMFKDTPFGTVQLNNFQKTGPNEFTIWMYVMRHNSDVVHQSLSVTWWNCHEEDARVFFGIERNEQNMWGS